MIVNYTEWSVWVCFVFFLLMEAVIFMTSERSLYKNISPYREQP